MFSLQVTLYTNLGKPVNGGPKFTTVLSSRVSRVELGLPLTVTIRVSRVSAMVSVRFSGIWDRRLQVCPNLIT